MAFSELSAGDAVAVARAEAPGVMRRRRARVLTLDEGQSVKGFVDPYTATVDAKGGADALVSSAVPMLAPRRGGGWALADLTLEVSGDEFVPRNPQARVRIARRLDRGVRFERSGWGVRVSDRPVDAQLVENKAFGANAVGRDTDVVVEPVVGGVEVSHVLRSAESPRSLALHVDVPSGGSLVFERVASGGPQDRVVLVRDKDEAIVGRVSAPVAADAQGTVVDAVLRIDGHTVFIDVAHGGEDLAYPVTVDPFVQEDFRFWLNGTPGSQPGRDFDGWSFKQVRNGSFDYSATAGAGLYTRLVPFPHVAFFDVGEWGWTAPASRNAAFPSDGTYIFKADFGPYGLSTRPPNQPCVQMGIYRGDGSPESSLVSRGFNVTDPYAAGPHTQCGPVSNQYRVTCTDQSNCSIPGTATLNGTVGNRAGFRLYAGNNPSVGLSLLGGSLIFYRDKAAPRPTNVAVAAGSGWIDDVQGSATASDWGVGLGRIVVQGTAPSGANWQQVSPTYCAYPTGNEYDGTGKRGSCPTTRTSTFRTDSAPEGDFEIAAVAQDIVGNNGQSPQNTRIRVDHTPPALTPSGPLWEDRDSDFAAGPYSLTVDATDAFAGVASVELLVDGVRQKPEHLAEGSRRSL